MDQHIILEIGLALAIIAAAGLLAGKIRFPIIPLIILAGMAVGPHAPVIGILDFRFVKSAALIEFMGRLGILFLLFYLGLEFSIGRLKKAGRSIITGGFIYMSFNFTLGILLPLILGWPFKEILVAAGITTISSSAIVAKAIIDLKRAARAETEMILGLMMFQDIFVAIYISILSGLVLTGHTSSMEALVSAVVALSFMLGILFLGNILTPLLNRWLNNPSDEVLTVVLFAILTLVAGFSEAVHLAEAVGALLVGLVLAETEHADRIEALLVPFRDFFGSLFFFSFGLVIDPLSLGGAVGPALIAVLLTILGNFISGVITGRATGYSHRGSVNIGLTIIPRGEFSIVLANLARSGSLLAILQPFTALYVLLLAIIGPLLTKESKWIYKKLALLLKWPPLIERTRKHEESVPRIK